MIVINNASQSRTAYAFEANGEFLLSPFPEARGGRRPIARFDSRDELETYAAARQHRVTWLDS